MSTSSLRAFVDILHQKVKPHQQGMHPCSKVGARKQNERTELSASRRGALEASTTFSIAFLSSFSYSVRFSCSSLEAALHVRVDREGRFEGDGHGSKDWGVRRRRRLKKWSRDSRKSNC